MAESEILETPPVQKLIQLLEEATRSTPEGVPRFVEPASGTLVRATSRQHHLVFGRRGSGKSSLLRKAASDLTVDRRPIAFVDLETFKGHTYPDVLLSILIETFSKFAEWLETAAIAPANKTSFWSRLFGRKPTRPPFDKAKAKQLAQDLRNSVADLRELLFSDDDKAVAIKRTTKLTDKDTSKDELSIGAGGLKAGLADETSDTSEFANERSESYKLNKLQHLHQHILDYKNLFTRMSALSAGDAFLFLDDLYHIRRRDQAQVIDYFHRIGKGNRLWIKVGTIRHRTLWYVHGDPPIGAKIGDDIDEIDLDLTLEKYNLTKGFLEKVLQGFLDECALNRDDILTDGAVDRLVLACGGVARDFLGILRRSVSIARARRHRSWSQNWRRGRERCRRRLRFI